MIDYIEKGAGLHEAIRQAGHWLRQENGEWVSSNDELVQLIINDYSLVQARARKCAEVTAHAKVLRDKVVSTISPGEMASWSLKALEATKFSASGNAADCPMLSLEAQARNIPLADLVAKVHGNTQRFSMAEAMIGGTDGRHRDTITALDDFEAINNYDFSSGWPVV
jgi:hypothetical protein